jgi:ElaB/YqjD/DUF883 family membrane-anchored ribosome-binding protein
MATNRSQIKDWFFPIIIGLAFGAFMYYAFVRLTSLSGIPVLTSQDIQQHRIHTLESEIARLEAGTHPVIGSGATTPEAAFQEGLKQHQAILDEVRAEIRVTQDQLKESSEAIKAANEVSKRTQDAETVFLALFGFIAALIAGQGYLQIRGWDERAEEALEEVNTATTGVNAFKSELDGIRSQMRSELDLLTAARASLDTELPSFLNDTKAILNVADATGPLQQEEITLMNQIDHLTFFNVPMRFAPHRSHAQASLYVESLRRAVRGYIAQNRIWDAEKRIDEFFALLKDDKHPTAATEQSKAQVHSYRAIVSYYHLKTLAADQSWVRAMKLDKIRDFRDRAFADIRASRACYTDADYCDIVEALLHSMRLGPEMTPPGVSSDEFFLNGQRKAVEIYRKTAPKAAPRKRRSALQNLACCLKRIADQTGDTADILAFERELSLYPTDRELADETSTEPQGRIDLNSLWQALMADSDLFASIDKLDKAHYPQFWEGLLDQKVVVRKWREDLKELQKRKPEMASWQVVL